MRKQTTKGSQTSNVFWDNLEEVIRINPELRDYYGSPSQGEGTGAKIREPCVATVCCLPGGPVQLTGFFLNCILREIKFCLRHGAGGDASEQTNSPRNNESLVWSGREDSNLRPQRPERCALTSCATPRTG